MEAYEADGYSGHILISLDDKTPFKISFSFKCRVELHLDNEKLQKSQIIDDKNDILLAYSTESFTNETETYIPEAKTENIFDDFEGYSPQWDAPPEISESKKQIDQLLKCVICGSTHLDLKSIKKHCLMHSQQSSQRKTKRNSNRIPEDLTCAYCKLSFESVNDFQSHRRSRNNPQTCSTCRKEFPSFAHYILHRSMEHGEGKYSQPTQYDDSENTGDRKKLKKFNCPLCGNSFYKYYLLRHVMFEHTCEGIFSCCICKKKFRTLSLLKQHCDTHLHGSKKGQGSIKCNPCGILFNNRRQFQEHLKEAHKHKSKCIFCHEEFLFYTLLKEHYSKVHYDSMFKCEICSALFAKQANLKSHLHKQHNSKLSGVCPKCGNVVRNLKQHIRDAHPSKTMIFPCSECPKVFHSSHALKKHTPMHSKTGFECQLCQKVLKNMNSLREHLKTHGYNRQEYECKICRKKMSKLYNLRAHMKTHNAPSQLHDCKLCNASFSYKHQLQTHVTAVHEF